MTTPEMPDRGQEVEEYIETLRLAGLVAVMNYTCVTPISGQGGILAWQAIVLETEEHDELLATANATHQAEWREQNREVLKLGPPYQIDPPYLEALTWEDVNGADRRIYSSLNPMSALRGAVRKAFDINIEYKMSRAA